MKPAQTLEELDALWSACGSRARERIAELEAEVSRLRRMRDADAETITRQGKRIKAQAAELETAHRVLADLACVARTNVHAYAPREFRDAYVRQINAMAIAGGAEVEG